MEDKSKMRVIVKPTGFSYGVRNDSGFQCFIPSVHHYTGQDARYEKELAEAREKAYLFAAAQDLLAALAACLPYMEEMEDANTEDLSVGIYTDRELSKAFDLAKSAIEKATNAELSK